MISRPLFGLFFSTFSVPAVSFSVALIGRNWAPIIEPQLHNRVPLYGMSLWPALKPKLRPFSCNKQILKMATTVLEFGVATPAKAPNTGNFIRSHLRDVNVMHVVATSIYWCSCFCREERSLAKRQTLAATWRGTSNVHCRAFSLQCVSARIWTVR